MKKNAISKLVLLLMFAAIVVGLFLPYFSGSSYGKAVFAYESA